MKPVETCEIGGIEIVRMASWGLKWEVSFSLFFSMSRAVIFAPLQAEADRCLKRRWKRCGGNRWSKFSSLSAAIDGLH